VSEDRSDEGARTGAIDDVVSEDRSDEGARTGAIDDTAVRSVREAATVVLLRDGSDGLETWLLRRVPKMAFAPGMSVFPGGAVDPADADGEGAPEVAAALNTTPEHAGVLLRAAVREIQEETEVLLDAQLLHPWARWITPEAEPRRYDTYFFVAVLPAGAAAAAVTSEASHADWLPVAEALAQYGRGERPMLPPTVATLTEVSRYRTSAEVLGAAARRDISPIQPVIRRDDAGALVADLGNGAVIELPDSFITASGKKPS
jgi:8-oxo-dGTP pyrophosphatase MutT (NUDIX family)